MRCTLLLVEDDGLLRDLMTEVLEAADFEVLAAASADDALELAAAREGPIDVMVTDVIMPGISGIELGKRLRATRIDLRVLLMSGYSPEFLAQRSSVHASDAVLQKPFSNHRLLARVQDLLERPVSHI
jgi:DNA-binding response OmpR family regulator